ncbi:MAG: GNAT family N-acetyltransferase [Thaumarchaeota archaeon]|nr:GNAT family N-acetyltransferase [Nitrososphaerota archaeon]
MKILQTFDEEYIARCHASVWKEIADDFSVNQTLFFPDMSDRNYWLTAHHDGEELGVFLGRKLNPIHYEAHIILLPSARGLASKAARHAVRWMFDNTQCERLIGCIPVYNKLAINVAHNAGFEDFGINKNSFMKNGKLWDQVFLGISRGI